MDKYASGGCEWQMGSRYEDLQVAKTIVEGAGRLVINVVWAWGEVQHMG